MLILVYKAFAVDMLSHECRCQRPARSWCALNRMGGRQLSLPALLLLADTSVAETCPPSPGRGCVSSEPPAALASGIQR